MPFSTSSYVGRIVFTSASDRAPGSGLTCLLTESWRSLTMISLQSLLSRYYTNSRAAFGAGAFFRMPVGDTIKTAPSSG